MYKIYSRPRIKIPKVVINTKNKFKNKRNKRIAELFIIIIIALSVVKLVLNSVLPIFDTLCEKKSKSIATIVCNKQATNVMKEHSYDELFTIEKDSSNNIKMIKSNAIAINEIISDVAIKIQNEIDNRGREDIKIAMRKFYRV